MSMAEPSAPELEDGSASESVLSSVEKQITESILGDKKERSTNMGGKSDILG